MGIAGCAAQGQRIGAPVKWLGVKQTQKKRSGGEDCAIFSPSSDVPLYYRGAEGASTGRTFFMRQFPLPWCEPIIWRVSRLVRARTRRPGDNDESTGACFGNVGYRTANTCRSAIVRQLIRKLTGRSGNNEATLMGVTLRSTWNDYRQRISSVDSNVVWSCNMRLEILLACEFL